MILPHLIAASVAAMIWAVLTIALIVNAWRDYRDDQARIIRRLDQPITRSKITTTQKATVNPPTKITRRIIQKPFAVSA